VAGPAAVVFRPDGQGDLAPSGEVSRLQANLSALRVLRLVQSEARAATADEQRVLARWSGWGALSAVFDSHPSDPQEWQRRFGAARTELGELLSPAEFTAARRTTVNAHYTHADYTSAIWDAMGRLGFAGGAVLEPGCGSGNFLGLAPAGTDLVGVEWDPTTAAIAQALYPQATILAESFADTRIPEATFDLAIGNVPFADVVLTDPSHNPSRLSIHNHFIVKSLHLVRPGGLVAVLTSRYTMDAVNPAARREIASLADLVAAVRLPAGAHRRAAGTEAVTDLLILRRRAPDAPVAGPAWEQARHVDVDGVAVAVNEYLLEHPDQVLGRLAVEHGHYRDNELTVLGDPDAGTALRTALHAVVAQAQVAGLVMTPRPDGAVAPRPVAARNRQPDDFIQAHPDGTFTIIEHGVAIPYDPPAKQAAELRALVRLRDVEIALLEGEAASIEGTDEIRALRVELNHVYDGYVATYGPLNRFGERTGRRVDPDTCEPAIVRVYPPHGGFRDDPYAAIVYGLEQLDPVRKVASKAELFFNRVVAPRTPRLGADTPADAVAICLENHGEIRLPEIARRWVWTRTRRGPSSASWSTTTRRSHSWCRHRSTCRAICATSSTRPAPPPSPIRGSRSTWPRCNAPCPATSGRVRSRPAWAHPGSHPPTCSSSSPRSWKTPPSRCPGWPGRRGRWSPNAATACWPSRGGAPNGARRRRSPSICSSSAPSG
jgi:SAM-dependent methyltransferase